jgi:hypothetical protein
MYTTVDIPPLNKEQKSSEVKRLGVQYWQQLCRVGVPLTDARKMAAAIAKYDIAQRPITPDERYLIIRYSPFVCRAQLWRGNMLL